MEKSMKLRNILALVGLAWCMTHALGQNSAQDDLPSAPSATQQKPQAQAPESPTPAAPATAAPPSPSTTSAKPAAPAAPPLAQPAAAPKTASSDPSKTSQEDDDSLTTIRRTVNEVNVVFTVTDKHGRYVKDLKKEDFKIIDDSKPAAEIRSFHAEADLPLQVGLLIDASNSIRDRFKFEQLAAIEFLNQTIRRRYDQAFVVGFDVTPEVTQDFTDDTEALAQGVRGLRPGGGTALYDALYFACRDKLIKSEYKGPVRRAIILLSDGDDNQSHVTREEAIEMAQRADVSVYTISTNLSGTSHHGDKVLERIADATGGRSYVPFQITEVSNAFLSIQEELRSQYAISYKPADFQPDGRYRTIDILAQAKGLHVRSRRGYFAPTQ
jgi:Ca-activated chloride channel family protein